MSKSFAKELTYSVGGNDECYTPDYGVTPILKYIPEGATVWCPFDTEESEFQSPLQVYDEKATATNESD